MLTHTHEKYLYNQRCNVTDHAKQLFNLSSSAFYRVVDVRYDTIGAKSITVAYLTVSDKIEEL